MLSNALSLLLCSVRNMAKVNPDAPVFFVHPLGKDKYQVIVQKIPEQEAVAA